MEQKSNFETDEIDTNCNINKSRNADSNQIDNKIEMAKHAALKSYYKKRNEERMCEREQSDRQNRDQDVDAIQCERNERFKSKTMAELVCYPPTTTLKFPTLKDQVTKESNWINYCHRFMLPQFHEPDQSSRL